MAKTTATEKLELRDGSYLFQLTNRIVPNVPGGSPFQPKKQLQNTHIVFDEDTNRVRSVRVIDGVDSIFVDEQIEKKIDEKWAIENSWAPVFIQGVLRLAYPQDRNKITAMLMLDGCKSKMVKRNPGANALFELVNTEQGAKTELDFFFVRKKAEDAAFEAIKNYPSIIAHAKHLGIPFMDGSRERLESEIKADYLRKASTDPVTFSKFLDNPLVILGYELQQAIADGTVNVTEKKGTAIWGATKVDICEIDLTRNPLDSLVEYATSAEGKKFLDQLKKVTTKK